MEDHTEREEEETTIELKTEDLGGSLGEGKSGILKKGVKFKDEDLKEAKDPKRFRYPYETCESKAPRKVDVEKRSRRVHKGNGRPCKQRRRYAPPEVEPRNHVQHTQKEYGMECDERDEEFTPRNDLK